MRRHFSIGLLAVLPCICLVAQGPAEQFELCVKQFDEFTARFNGHHRSSVVDSGMVATPAPDRRQLLRSLMGTGLDPATTDDFIASVLDAAPTYELQLDGQPWFAHVTCDVSDTSNIYAIDFWLVRERSGMRRKWSILASSFDYEKESPLLFIGSKNHEVNFSQLLGKDILMEHGVAPYLGPPGVRHLFALQEGLKSMVWTIDAVTQVRMHLLQIPGWFAEVEYRPPPARDGWVTSGWNIVELRPMSDADKTMYIWHEILGL